MRTENEIVDRMKYNTKQWYDFLGENSDLAVYLSYENLKEFILSKLTKEEWDKVRMTLSDDIVKSEIKDYLSSAFDIANNQRGISAFRSLNHFRNWIWLLGDDELLTFLDDDDNYPMYGLPILKKIKEKYYPDLKVNG